MKRIILVYVTFFVFVFQANADSEAHLGITDEMLELLPPLETFREVPTGYLRVKTGEVYTVEWFKQKLRDRAKAEEEKLKKQRARPKRSPGRATALREKNAPMAMLEYLPSDQTFYATRSGYKSLETGKVYDLKWFEEQKKKRGRLPTNPVLKYGG